MKAGKPYSCAGVGASCPAKGEFLAKKLLPMMQAGWLSAHPLHPLRIVSESNRALHRAASPSPAPESARQAPPGAGRCACGRTGGFPRGKQSARPALPCAPLVVCLNSGSLTAFGGCAHWARASLRSPQSPSGRSWRKTQRGINIPAEKQGAFRSPPCTPFGPHSARKMRGKQSGKNVGAFIKANNRRANPRREQGVAPAGAQNAFLKAKHQRGSRCRALHRPFAATTRRGCPQKQNPRRRPNPAAGVPFSFRGKSEKPLT